MSYISIVRGKIIETTGGSDTIYADNIIYEAKGTISQTGVEEGVSYEKDPEFHESNETLKGVKVFATIYFDGTKNNRNNTFRRLDKDTKSNTSEDSKTVYKNNKEKESSYENGYSNVAALSYMAINDPKNKIITRYIEGQGTEDNQKGFKAGLGFGGGSTGIPAKATKGFGILNTDINGVLDRTSEYVRELTINVFGFSRGAAAARHFITSTRANFKTNYPKAKIIYKFVGLFDSVSSYEKTNDGFWGIAGSATSHNFNNDVAELGLNLGAIPQKIVHLVAGNEYRQNFALTTISGSIKAGIGYELQIPGAHSDIGGGYEEYEHTETRYVNRDGWPSKKEWISEGWYTEDQLIGQHSENDPVNFDGVRKLTNSYQFVPLAIMMEFAKKHGISFESIDLNVQNKAFSVIPELESIRTELLNYAVSNDGATSAIATIEAVATLKKLRNKYLHILANAQALGMKPNHVNSKLERQIIEDNV